MIVVCSWWGIIANDCWARPLDLFAIVSEDGVGLNTISSQYSLEGTASALQNTRAVVSINIIIYLAFSYIIKFNIFPSCNEHPKTIEISIHLLLLYQLIYQSQ